MAISSSLLDDCDFIGGHIVLITEDEVKINGRVYQINSDDGTLFTIDETTHDEKNANSLIQDMYKKWCRNNSCSIRKTFRDLLFKKQQITNDAWGAVILAAIQVHIKKTGASRFYQRELYPTIALYLGASDEDVKRKKYVCYHPVSGKKISDMGYVRTWIQERSPCSRQRYWRANIRSERKFDLLFINPVLGQHNIARNWMPGSQVRGDYWYFDPEEARRWYVMNKPSNAVLTHADASIDPAKRGRMQGTGHSSVPKCVIGTVSSFRLF
jgi:hypothetical protein